MEIGADLFNQVKSLRKKLYTTWKSGKIILNAIQRNAPLSKICMDLLRESLTKNYGNHNTHAARTASNQHTLSITKLHSI